MRFGCEAVTLLGSLSYLVGAANEARFQGGKMFIENLVSESNGAVVGTRCEARTLVGYNGVMVRGEGW